MDNILVPLAADTQELVKMTLFKMTIGICSPGFGWATLDQMLSHFVWPTLGVTISRTDCCLPAGCGPQNSLSDSLRDISLGP